MIQPNKNPPKFFFNFIGPESDDQDYMPITPEIELTLAVPASAAEETHKPAVPKENPRKKEFGVKIRENVESRTDKLKRKLTTSGRHKRVGSDPSLFSLVEEDATDKKQKNVVDEPEGNPDAAAEGTQPYGSESRGKKRRHEETAMPERMKNLPDWLREIWEAKKKIIDEEKGKDKEKEKENEKEKAEEKAEDSNTSKVIIKGAIKKDDNGRVIIVCMCHDRAHNADEFISHAGGEESSDQTQFVIVLSDKP